MKNTRNHNACSINNKKTFQFQDEIKRKTIAPGGAQTPDLRITLATLVVHASTAYEYDALTDCATGAWCPAKGFAVCIKYIENILMINKSHFKRLNGPSNL